MFGKRFSFAAVFTRFWLLSWLRKLRNTFYCTFTVYFTPYTRVWIFEGTGFCDNWTFSTENAEKNNTYKTHTFIFYFFEKGKSFFRTCLIFCFAVKQKTNNDCRKETLVTTSAVPPPFDFSHFYLFFLLFFDTFLSLPMSCFVFLLSTKKHVGRDVDI